MSFESIGKRETLPEKVCRVIKESILTGELKGGDALPTEPELEAQFGVSRAVIRDAVRMLKGQGLIEVQHGKGMYVTHSQINAFTDALITSLRRDKASAWDVEQFERLFLPQAFALAAETATTDQKKNIRRLGLRYIEVFTDAFDDDEVARELVDSFHDFMLSIFDSTGNKMIRLIGEVLLAMRKFRSVDTGTEPDKELILKMETAFIHRYIEAVECGEGEKASVIMKEILKFNDPLTEILEKTPLGETPVIPLELMYKAYKI